MRVGAVLRIDANAVWLLGYGEYAGREVPVGEVTGLSAERQAAGRMDDALALDSGHRVYGGECWWGPEPKVRALIERYAQLGFEVKETQLRT